MKRCTRGDDQLRHHDVDEITMRSTPAVATQLPAFLDDFARIEAALQRMTKTPPPYDELLASLL